MGANNNKLSPMKIIAWNVRGTAHPEFKKAIRDLVRKHKPKMLFILQTRLPVSRMDKIKRMLEFDSAHRVDSNGLSGGIWMLWDSSRISVDILPHGTQGIHALVTIISNPKFNVLHG